jgi:hypothetical protein
LIEPGKLGVILYNGQVQLVGPGSLFEPTSIPDMNKVDTFFPIQEHPWFQLNL